MKEEDKKIIKETLMASRFGLILFGGFWTLSWLGMPVIWLYVSASLLIVVAHIMNSTPPFNILQDFAWLTGIILLAVWLGAFLGGRGLLGLIIIVLLFSLIVLFRRRKIYMAWIYHIEERFLYGVRLGRKK